MLSLYIWCIFPPQPSDGLCQLGPAAALHCTMGKLKKKTAEIGQLWELISQQFFAEKAHNFAQCCVNSPRISEKNNFEKTEEEKGEKSQKLVDHVC